jgi:uncharacterized membrane protein
VGRGQGQGLWVGFRGQAQGRGPCVWIAQLPTLNLTLILSLFLALILNLTLILFLFLILTLILNLILNLILSQRRRRAAPEPG